MLVAALSPEATRAQPVVAPQHVMPPRSLSGVLPAYRPFGVVFVIVLSVSSALTHIACSLFAPLFAPVVLMVTEAVRSLGVETSVIAALIVLSLLLTLLGLLEITGAIGLWLMAQWGRRLTAWLQVVGILEGIVLLIVSGTEQVQRQGQTGSMVVLGLLSIFGSIAILVYLLRAEMDVWFRKQ